MTGRLNDICCASIPREALPLLADLRTSSDLRAHRRGERVWLRWPPGAEEILRCVLPINGADVFALRDGLWYRPGRSLPVFDVPDDADSKTLLHLLVPAPFEAAGQPDRKDWQPVPLRLVRDGQPHHTSALECGATELLRWADDATTHAIGSVEVAACKERVLMLGARLPPLADAARFWGQSLFLPLGFRPEPNLPESVLREALVLLPDEIVFLREDRAEVVGRSVFRPATRAGIRRAWGVGAQ
jgi:MoxR-vWA-beta-propeller ternary system domain bpX2/FtsH ternary system domain X7